MPANLTPQYLESERKFKAAQTPEEKIAALEEMMATIPKHKGTEKIQADLKKRLSKLREAEEQRGGKRGDPHHIRREGAAQAVIVGSPNAGKSQLLARLTTARPEVAPYPFTTQRPMPGMMPFEDIQIQLVDTGPVTADRLAPYHSNLLRPTDLVLLVADLEAADPAAQTAEVVRALREVKIHLLPDPAAEPDEFGVAKKKTLLVANKADTDDGTIAELVREALPKFPMHVVSAERGNGLEDLRRAVFGALDILRVYSKMPGHPADMDAPFVLKRGGTVMDVARLVHKDFADKLKYARIWGSERYSGQMVQRDYVVRDKDVIELHM